MNNINDIALFKNGYNKTYSLTNPDTYFRGNYITSPTGERRVLSNEGENLSINKFTELKGYVFKRMSGKNKEERLNKIDFTPLLKKHGFIEITYRNEKTGRFDIKHFIHRR